MFGARTEMNDVPDDLMIEFIIGELVVQIPQISSIGSGFVKFVIVACADPNCSTFAEPPEIF